MIKMYGILTIIVCFLPFLCIRIHQLFATAYSKKEVERKKISNKTLDKHTSNLLIVNVRRVLIIGKPLSREDSFNLRALFCGQVMMIELLHYCNLKLAPYI